MVMASYLRLHLAWLPCALLFLLSFQGTTAVKPVPMDKNGQMIQFRHVLQAQGSRLASAATASVQQIAREPTSPLKSAPPFAASQPRRSRALIDALVHNGADASAAWGPNFAPLRSLSQVTPSYSATATPQYTSQPVAPAPTYSATSTPTPTYTSAPALTPAPIEELPKPSCTIETTGCITLNATSATVADAILVDAQGWLQPTIQSATSVGLTYEFGMVSMGNFHPLIPTPTPNPSYILAAGMLPLGMHSLYMCVYAAYVDNLAPIIPGIEPPAHTTRQCAMRYVSVTHPAPVCMRNNVSECIVVNASRLLTSMGAWVELAAADWLAPEGAALQYAFGVVVKPTSNPITSVPVVTPTSETFPPEISLTPSPTADPVDILNGESETTVPQTQATETFMVLHGPDYSPTYTFSLTAVGLGAGMHVLRVCAYAVDPASIPAGNASASGLVMPSHPACADSVVEVMPEPVEPITEEAPDTGSLPLSILAVDDDLTVPADASMTTNVLLNDKGVPAEGATTRIVNIPTFMRYNSIDQSAFSSLAARPTLTAAGLLSFQPGRQQLSTGDIVTLTYQVLPGPDTMPAVSPSNIATIRINVTAPTTTDNPTLPPASTLPKPQCSAEEDADGVACFDIAPAEGSPLDTFKLSAYGWSVLPGVSTISGTSIRFTSMLQYEFGLAAGELLTTLQTAGPDPVAAVTGLSRGLRHLYVCVSVQYTLLTTPTFTSLISDRVCRTLPVNVVAPPASVSSEKLTAELSSVLAQLSGGSGSRSPAALAGQVAALAASANVNDPTLMTMLRQVANSVMASAVSGPPEQFFAAATSVWSSSGAAGRSAAASALANQAARLAGNSSTPLSPAAAGSAMGLFGKMLKASPPAGGASAGAAAAEAAAALLSAVSTALSSLTSGLLKGAVAGAAPITVVTPTLSAAVARANADAAARGGLRLDVPLPSGTSGDDDASRRRMLLQASTNNATTPSASVPASMGERCAADSACAASGLSVSTTFSSDLSLTLQHLNGSANNLMRGITANASMHAYAFSGNATFVSGVLTVDVVGSLPLDARPSNTTPLLQLSLPVDTTLLSNASRMVRRLVRLQDSTAWGMGAPSSCGTTWCAPVPAAAAATVLTTAGAEADSTLLTGSTNMPGQYVVVQYDSWAGQVTAPNNAAGCAVPATAVRLALSLAAAVVVALALL